MFSPLIKTPCPVGKFDTVISRFGRYINFFHLARALTTNSRNMAEGSKYLGALGLLQHASGSM